MEGAPRNSYLNVLLNLSDKGVSKLYIPMKDSFSHVLDIAVTKWGENTDLDFGRTCLSRSFQKHHLTYKDTYSKYIQLRMLQHRFYTNEKLFKIGIKKSDLCSFCGTNVDSVDTLQCAISRDLWSSVESWIVEFGMENDHLSIPRNILGDLETALSINTIILITEEVIYNPMKKEQKPHFINV